MNKKFLKGVYDKKWSEWYSEYLLKEGLSKYLKRISIKTLSNFLKKSNEKRIKLNKNLDWASYTGKKIYERFVE